jgi:CRP-like cAMP-binding protein
MTETARPTNRILQALPPDEYQRIAPELERINLHTAQLLYEQGGPMEFAWFPATGLLSTIVMMEDGSSAEGSAVGHEGLVGLTLALGDTVAVHRVITQVDSESWRIPARNFRLLAADNPGFRELLFRYAVALLQQACRNAACNRLHSVEQRMARWLLFTNDRVGEPEYHLTQTFLAEMLGVERPTVSVTAGRFQRAGLISYKRGRFKILDHERLKEAACECYVATTTVYRRLLGV